MIALPSLRSPLWGIIETSNRPEPEKTVGTRGFGREAKLLASLESIASNQRSTSFYIGFPAERLIEELWQLTIDPEEDVAPPGVNVLSAVYATHFLLSLPTAEYLPTDISIDPDGEVSFDWGEGNRRFAVSVSPSGTLAFAGIVDNERLVGRELLSSRFVPKQVLNGIRRATS